MIGVAEIIDLSLLQMSCVFLLLILPLSIVAYLRLGFFKDTLFAILRMAVQLALVGVYLKTIFTINSFLLNLLWMIIMVVVADFSILRQARLVRKHFFFPILAGTSIATFGISFFMVMVIISPDPIYDARYLIPIFGMTLGNCMRSNVMSLERFYGGLRENEKEFITRQLLGASLIESTHPFFKKALKATIGPSLATMATMGIVSLPGMMTGQILGGSLPTTAIKYQIAIMICIFSIMICGSFLNILFSFRVGFNNYGMLKSEVFTE